MIVLTERVGVIRKAIKAPQVPERDVLKACLDYLHTLPHSRWYRRNVGRSRMKGGFWVQFNRKGQSDIWGILEGRHYEIECKKRGEEPDDDQTAWIEDCRSVGAVAFWVDSVDMLIEKLAGYSARNAF